MHLDKGNLSAVPFEVAGTRVRLFGLVERQRVHFQKCFHDSWWNDVSTGGYIEACDQEALLCSEVRFLADAIVTSLLSSLRSNV